MSQPLILNDFHVNKAADAVLCRQCKLPLQEKFIQVLDHSYHPGCFHCEDCQVEITDKFFPFKLQDGSTITLCKKDYFKRTNLVCARCNEPLEDSHISVLDKRYHFEHFSCTVCQKVFEQDESCFEHGGLAYCQEHYSLLFAPQCSGCGTPVLKNFVEITTEKNIVQRWHPQCFMVYKLWNIKIRCCDMPMGDGNIQIYFDHSYISEILQILTGFEEAAAECISNFFILLSNEQRREAIIEAARLVSYVEIVLNSLSEVANELRSKDCGRPFTSFSEPRRLVRIIITFLSSFYNQPEELPLEEKSLQKTTIIVTRLARTLKETIRQLLINSLKLESDSTGPSSVQRFLRSMDITSNSRLVHVLSSISAPIKTLCCRVCKKLVDQTSYLCNRGYWHEDCANCSICSLPASSDPREASVNPDNGKLYCGTHYMRGNIKQMEKLSLVACYVLLLHISLRKLCSTFNIKFDAKGIKELERSENARMMSYKDVADELRKDSRCEAVQNISQALSPDENNTPKTAELEQSITKSLEECQLEDKSLAECKLEDKAFAECKIDDATYEVTPEDCLRDLKYKVSFSLKTPSNSVFDLSDIGRWVLHRFAVRSIHSLLGDQFSIDKITAMASHRRQVKWSRVLGSLKRLQKQKGMGLFGVALEVLNERCGVNTKLVERLGQLKIPYFVDSSIRKLLGMDLGVEGIFRKPGNLRKIKVLSDSLNQDPFFEEFGDDAINLASLLKKFLRELPEPILTYKLYELFVAAQSLKTEQMVVDALRYICFLLPKDNLDILAILLWFFQKVSRMCVKDTFKGDEGNKMDLNNLAIVLAPSFLDSKTRSIDDVHYTREIAVLHSLLKHQDQLWLVPGHLFEKGEVVQNS